MLHDSIATDQDGELACELPSGFKLLQGQYQIEQPLIGGGFGITYLARDSLDRRVVIKECFPAGLCGRRGAKVEPLSKAEEKACRSVLRSFLREARWLARPQHPNIVGVHQVFKENNTAYIAMEFIDGLDLLTIREDQPERLTGRMLQDILVQALDALSCIHGLNILHRDVSPDNFLLDSDGKLTIIDFGAACGDLPNDDTALSGLLPVKDGYSPHEMYKPDLTQRPSSDLFSLGATMEFLITGEAPPNSQERLQAITAGEDDPRRQLAGGPWDYDPEFLAAIDKALSVLPADRFQSAQEWLDRAAPGHQVRSEPARPEVQETSAGPQKAGPALDAVIADLVASTNKVLKPSLPRSARAEAPEPVAPKPAGRARQLVDIFGDPVSNIETWLKEQDGLARRAAAQQAAVQAAAEERVAPPKLRREVPVPEPTKTAEQAPAAKAKNTAKSAGGPDTGQNSLTGRVRKLFGLPGGSATEARD